MKKAYLLPGVASGVPGRLKYILKNLLYKGIAHYKENHIKSKALTLF